MIDLCCQEVYNTFICKTKGGKYANEEKEHRISYP